MVNYCLFTIHTYGYTQLFYSSITNAIPAHDIHFLAHKFDIKDHNWYQ